MSKGNALEQNRRSQWFVGIFLNAILGYEFVLNFPKRLALIMDRFKLCVAERVSPTAKELWPWRKKYYPYFSFQNDKGSCSFIGYLSLMKKNIFPN